MEFEEINFHKINRRPVTDNTYQTGAEEWNALGVEIQNHRARLNNIENIQSGGQGDLSGFCTKEELNQYQALISTLIGSVGMQLITQDEYSGISPKQFKYYFVAKDATDKAKGKCWKIYLRTQLVGTFNVDGSLTMPRFPMKFPFRLA